MYIIIALAIGATTAAIIWAIAARRAGSPPRVIFRRIFGTIAAGALLLFCVICPFLIGAFIGVLKWAKHNGA